MGYCKRKGVICTLSDNYCSTCVDAKCKENIPDYTVEDVLSDLRTTYSFAPNSLANTLLLRAATLIEKYRDLYVNSVSKFDPFTAGMAVKQLQHESELKEKEKELEKVKKQVENLTKENSRLADTLVSLQDALNLETVKIDREFIPKEYVDNLLSELITKLKN